MNIRFSEISTNFLEQYCSRESWLKSLGHFTFIGMSSENLMWFYCPTLCPVTLDTHLEAAVFVLEDWL